MKGLEKICFMVFAGFLFLYGCSSTPKTAKFTPIQDLKAPEWVVKEGGAYGGEKGKAFYAAGLANIKSAALLMSTADNRARAAMAQKFNNYTAMLAKDYMASTSAGESNVSSEEQHVEQVIKNVAQATLSGVEIVDHWQNPETGDMYSLARLDMEAFKDNIDKAKELDSKVRDYIRQNAERLHEQLEKEEAKRKEAEK